jgi:hypothetical protein
MGEALLPEEEAALDRAAFTIDEETEKSRKAGSKAGK